jgi:sulfhydrogenase subunit beta (sulfur reductase)
VAKRVQARLAADQVDKLIRVLARRDYEVFGPVVRDGAVVYDSVEALRDLPQGHTDEQCAGRYRLNPPQGDALFAYAVGPQSWKKYLHPPRVRLFQAEQKEGVFRILNDAATTSKRKAFIGVRACELAAIQIQDRVFLNGLCQDPIYRARRDGLFFVAVQCTHASGTCFCASMGTGPRVRTADADLTLTEVVTEKDHWLLVEPGTNAGREVLAELDHQQASDDDREFATRAVEAAASQQARQMDTTGIHELLSTNFEHPRWEQIAERCMGCANCTMVCPTCFCTTVEDVTDLTGEHAERWRVWDSCLTTNFSFIHGGSIRTSGKAKFRQWITHKLSAWIDQFGSSGCVGCGRCITWCPAGIDITEEIRSIRGAV